MASDLKAQLEFTADASGVEAGVGAATKSLANLGKSAEQAGKRASDGIEKIGDGADTAARKVEAGTRNMEQALQRQIAAAEAGASGTRKYYEALINQRGLDTNRLKPLLDQLDAVQTKNKAAQDALAQASPKLEKLGVSAAQTAAAMRQVPAQFTDIVVALQGGQQPLTVLLQQGGQLKDMFGGIGPAAQALGGYLGSLVSPLTVAAAAAAALGYAFYQAHERQLEFLKATLSTGDSVGYTAGQLDDMAKAVGAVAKSQGTAKDALIGIATSGKVAASELRIVSTAVALEAEVMGTKVSEAMSLYTRLADEPTKAAQLINQSLHFINAATFERIQALEDQERKEEAAAIAQSALAQATIDRMKQVQDQAGYLSKALSGVANVAAGMWNTIAGGIASLGASASPTDQLKEAKNLLDYLQTRGSSAEALANAQQAVLNASKKVLMEQNAAYANAQRAADEQAKIRASSRWAQMAKDNRTQAEIRKELIDQTVADGKLLGRSQAEIDKSIAAINQKHKDKKGRTERDTTKRDARAVLGYDVEEIRAAAGALSNTVNNNDRLLEARRSANLIADQEYWSEKRGLIEQGNAIEEAALKKEIDRLQQEKLTGADRTNNLKKIAEAQAKLDKARENGATAVQIHDIRSADSIAKVKARFKEAEAAAQSYVDTLVRANDRDLAGMGLGNLARSISSRVSQRDDQFQTRKDQLDSQRRANQITQQEYDRYLEIEEASHARALRADREYWDKRLGNQASFTKGASEALRNYYDESQNVFDQTARGVTDAFQGMEDALVDFVTTGKADFKSLVDSMLKDIARIVIKQQITGPLANALSGAFKAGGGGASSGDDYTDILTGLKPSSSSGSGWFGNALSFLGGLVSGRRAIGGPVAPNSLYQVNERGRPELLTMGGNQYLMTGAHGGKVSPDTGGAGVVQYLNFTVGDVPTMERVRQEVQASQRMSAAALQRSRNYGGNFSP